MKKHALLRILIFADWFEPGLNGGGLIRSAVNVARLLQHDFQVYVFTRDRDFRNTKAYQGIVKDEWIDFDQQIRVFYCSPNHLTYSFISNICTSVHPDVIYLNSMYSYFFTLIPLWFCNKNLLETRIILAPRGMLHQGAIQLKYLKKRSYLLLLRYSGLLKRIKFHVTDKQEEVDVLNYFGNKAEIKLVPDLPVIGNEQVRNPEKRSGALKCLFLSRIAPKKNLLFVLHLLREIDFKVSLSICGPIEQEKYWEQCKLVINKLPLNIKVKYKGSIKQQELINLWETHHLFILPTFGENFGHSIFESLASGTPVIISDQTPWKNLEGQKAGISIPLKEEQNYKNALARFAEMNDLEFQAWSQGARKYAQTWIENNDFKKQYFMLFGKEDLFISNNIQNVDFKAPIYE